MRLEKLKSEIRALVEEFHVFEPNYQLWANVSEVRTETKEGSISSFDIKVSATLTV